MLSEQIEFAEFAESLGLFTETYTKLESNNKRVCEELSKSQKHVEFLKREMKQLQDVIESQGQREKSKSLSLMQQNEELAVKLSQAELNLRQSEMELKEMKKIVLEQHPTETTSGTIASSPSNHIHPNTNSMKDNFQENNTSIVLMRAAVAQMDKTSKRVENLEKKVENLRKRCYEQWQSFTELGKDAEMSREMLFELNNCLEGEQSKSQDLVAQNSRNQTVIRELRTKLDLAVQKIKNLKVELESCSKGISSAKDIDTNSKLCVENCEKGVEDFLDVQRCNIDNLTTDETSRKTSKNCTSSAAKSTTQHHADEVEELNSFPEAPQLMELDLDDQNFQDW